MFRDKLSMHGEFIDTGRQMGESDPSKENKKRDYHNFAVNISKSLVTKRDSLVM